MRDVYSRRKVIAGGLTCAFIAGSAVAAQPRAWEAADIPPSTMLPFEDRRGKKLSLADFRGRPLLLNIWATWCAPCVIELPALDRLQRDMGARLSVLALSVDRGGMAVVLPALKTLRIRRLQAYVDSSGEAVSKLKAPSLPTTIAIAPTGAFLSVRRGRIDWDDRDERNRLASILKL